MDQFVKHYYTEFELNISDFNGFNLEITKLNINNEIVILLKIL